MHFYRLHGWVDEVHHRDSLCCRGLLLKQLCLGKGPRTHRQQKRHCSGILAFALASALANEVKAHASRAVSRKTTRTVCHAAGRKDLVTAVHRCGGFQAVASYLGATFQETRGRPLGSRGAQAAKCRSPGCEHELFRHG